jgi:hypothetical protein
MFGWRWGDSDDDDDDDDEDDDESEPPALTESGEMGNESPTECSDEEEQMLTPRFNPTPFFPTILPDVVADVADDVAAAAAGCASSCMARLDSLTMKRFVFFW